MFFIHNFYRICFSAYYEESEYEAGHYQSVLPISDNATVRDIHSKGGFDVTTFLKLSEGEFVLYCSV